MHPKKTNKVKAVSVVLALLLLCQAAASLSLSDFGITAKIENPLITVVNEGATTLAKVWILTSTSGMYDFFMTVFKNLPDLIKANPPVDGPYGFRPMQAFFIGMAQPFLILAIVSTAAYLLLFSGSPKGRSKAKAALARLIYVMVLMSLAPYISMFLLNVSGTLTKALLGQVNVQNSALIMAEGSAYMYDVFSHLTMLHRTGGVEVLLLWETFLLILNFALALRYLCVILWNILLPMTILFYAFTPTKHIGKKFLHQTFLWSFMPIGWALAAIAISASYAGLTIMAPDFPAEKLAIAALLVMIGTPAMMLGVKDWLSLAVEVVEIVNAAPLSISVLAVDEMKVEREVITEEEALEGV